MALGRHPTLPVSPGLSALPLGRRPGFLLTVAAAEENLARHTKATEVSLVEGKPSDPKIGLSINSSMVPIVL